MQRRNSLFQYYSGLNINKLESVNTNDLPAADKVFEALQMILIYHSDLTKD
jgi:hypothetical protein